MKIVMPVQLGQTSVLTSNVPYPSASDPAEWSSGTPYKLGNTCRVSAIIYEARKENQGINPTTDCDDNWQEAGLVNKYALIDSFIGSKTIATVEEDGVWKIELLIDLGDSFVDTMGLFGMVGKKLTVRQYSKTTEDLVSETVINLQDESRVTDCFSYFFEPFYYKNDVVLPLALYRSRVSIILENPEVPAKIGAVSAGRTVTLGMCRTGTESGVNDYPKRSTTLLGYERLEKGRTAKRKKFDVTCASSDQDKLEKIIAEVSGTPAIFITAGFFESNIIYGYCRSFGFYYSTSDLSYFSMDVESLI